MGHATSSAAAATVLAHLFPADQETLLAQAFEAKQSRLWAGIHHQIDCDMDATMGDAVGRLTVHAEPLGTMSAPRLSRDFEREFE